MIVTFFMWCSTFGGPGSRCRRRRSWRRRPYPRRPGRTGCSSVPGSSCVLPARQHDEELAAVGRRPARVGHRHASTPGSSRSSPCTTSAGCCRSRSSRARREPVPVGSPPWTTKPGMTRWKTDTVEEVVAGEEDEVVHRRRRGRSVHPDDEGPDVGDDRGVVDAGRRDADRRRLGEVDHPLRSARRAARRADRRDGECSPRARWSSVGVGGRSRLGRRRRGRSSATGLPEPLESTTTSTTTMATTMAPAPVVLR